MSNFTETKTKNYGYEDILQNTSQSVASARSGHLHNQFFYLRIGPGPPRLLAVGAPIKLPGHQPTMPSQNGLSHWN
jgi:hypothetical protein